MDVDLVGKVGEEWNESHKPLFFKDNPRAVLDLLTANRVEEVLSRQFEVCFGIMNLGRQPGGNERKGVQLPVGMRHGHSDHASLVLENEDVANLFLFPEEGVAVAPQTEQVKKMVVRQPRDGAVVIGAIEDHFTVSLGWKRAV